MNMKAPVPSGRKLLSWCNDNSHVTVPIKLQNNRD